MPVSSYNTNLRQLSNWEVYFELNARVIETCRAYNKRLAWDYNALNLNVQTLLINHLKRSSQLQGKIKNIPRCFGKTALARKLHFKRGCSKNITLKLGQPFRWVLFFCFVTPAKLSDLYNFSNLLHNESWLVPFFLLFSIVSNKV